MSGIQDVVARKCMDQFVGNHSYHVVCVCDNLFCQEFVFMGK